MLIYGSKLKSLAAEMITDQCSNCGTHNSIQMSVFQKYFHIFWLPFIPIRKSGATLCHNCKQVLQKNEFNGNLKEKYEIIKLNTKTPIWTFSGLTILIVIIIWDVISGKQKDAKNAQFILTPQKGDIYHIRKDYDQYTLYKIDKVEGDTVFLLMNQYETNKETGLNNLKNKGDRAYIYNSIPMIKNDLKIMLDKGKILEIDRK